MIKHCPVTAIVSTKNRYFTTLPNLLISIILQTVKPNELIIYDDGDRLDLRKESVYENIFLMLAQNDISWRVEFGTGIGQVANHQRSIEDAKNEWIWRLDDDNVAAPDCLEKLFRNITDDVGAVGGLVLDPKFKYQTLNPLASSKIEDIYAGLNLQWYQWEGKEEVDHLYSTFIFRKSAAEQIDGYCKDLSMVGHREETIFTYSLKRANWKLIVDSEAVTWHMRDSQGGIRSGSRMEMWQHDEEIFRNKLYEWGVVPKNIKLCVLDSGMGDHLVFSKILPELKKKHSNVVLAVCYPEIFADDKDVTLLSIADAQQMCNIEEHNVYKWMWDHNWSKSLEDAYRGMFDA
jgi:glycosyltransferase involved in cell wall biosynthesis